MADKLLSSARYAGGGDVQAFPLGGRVFRAAVSGAAPAALGVITGAASSVMLFVPADRTLYVGHAAQVGALQGDAARAVMFPLVAGVWTFVLTDADQAVLRILGDADFTMPILEAACLGGDA